MKRHPMQFEVMSHYPKGWSKHVHLEGDGVLEVGQRIEIAGDKYHILDVEGYNYLLDRALDERLVNQDMAYSDGTFVGEIISQPVAEQMIERVLQRPTLRMTDVRTKILAHHTNR